MNTFETKFTVGDIVSIWDSYNDTTIIGCIEKIVVRRRDGKNVIVYEVKISWNNNDADNTITLMENPYDNNIYTFIKAFGNIYNEENNEQF